MDGTERMVMRAARLAVTNARRILSEVANSPRTAQTVLELRAVSTAIGSLGGFSDPVAAHEDLGSIVEAYLEEAQKVASDG